MKIITCEKKHKVYLKPDRDGVTSLGTKYLTKDKLYTGTLSSIVNRDYLHVPACLCFDINDDADTPISARAVECSHLEDGKGSFYYPSFDELISIAKNKSCFFTVWFIKKDGTERKMTCRFGVKKHLKGGKSTLDENKFYIVYSMADKDYRAVNKETVFRVKISGVTYERD